MVSIQFLGAAGTVTGSKHLLKAGNKKILIDCGLFQGIKQLRQKNWEPLPIDITDIHVVLLTHAHLDHCGYLPLLSKSGYQGKILMTPPTCDLAEIILRDSAKIQEEDAEKVNRLGYSEHKPAKPLYTLADAEKVIRQFETIKDREWVEIDDHIKFRFIRNGHILGSALIEVQCFGKTIIFSGDIGRNNSDLMLPPEQIEGCDFLVMESTYGDRKHKAIPAKTELADIINTSLHEKGNLLIPSFAVGRAQELMHMINELKKEILIPDVPVFMDSPMGASATEVFRKYPEWHKLNERQCRDVFQKIHIISDHKETEQVINDVRIKIVIAASGMLTGGRVLEYLEKYIGEKKNTILLVGYQAEGTRGRSLRSGVPEIKLFGRYHPVIASVREITSLSAHADQREMIEWISRFRKLPEKIFLVHGEPAVRDAFRIKILDEFGIASQMPLQNDEFALFN